MIWAMLSRSAESIGSALVLLSWHALCQPLPLLGLACLLGRRSPFQSTPALRRKLWLAVSVTPLFAAAVCVVVGVAGQGSSLARWLLPMWLVPSALDLAPGPGMSTADLPGFLATGYWCFFLAGMGLFLGEVLAARWLAASCSVPVPERLAGQFARLTADEGLSGVRLGVSRDTVGVCVAGIRRPVVVIPDLLARGEALNPDHWDAVFRHELGHVRRRDNVVLLLGQLIAAIFPLPPVWLARRWLRDEMETACDLDAVGAGNIEPREYADLLIDLMPLRHRSALAAAMATLSPGASAMSKRVEQILRLADGPLEDPLHPRRASLPLAVVLLVSSPTMALAASYGARHGYD